LLNTTGLSLDQAPPIHLPLRLFLTAPWFAFAAGLLLAGHGDEIFASRWTPAAMAVTHLIAIGFLGQIMCGALMQMLPVIVGAPIPGVVLIGTLTHLALSGGAVLMAFGFLGSGNATLAAGAALAAIGFLSFLVGAVRALHGAKSVAASRHALWFSLLALGLTVVIGLMMIMVLGGWTGLPRFPYWVQAHLSLGLLGWAGLLVMGVGYQVVPMFHVTPEYPAWMTRVLAPLIFIALTAAVLLPFANRDRLALIALSVLALGYTVFAVVTIRLQRHRVRPRIDATLLHWWSAMGSIPVAVVGWWFNAPAELIGVLLLVGVGIGLTSGMLFKIVPFLCWFHLQHRQIATMRLDVRIPHMHGFFPERLARWHFFLHVAALSALAGASLEYRLALPGGLLLGASALLLAGLLSMSTLRFAWASRELAAPQSAQG